ncbi:unnamed protein product [Ceratitis capitata]|uniref:(Mediterranean fruit fly) hypothetical protein n=1 Tax=Ceratitis capitata TaxID=7213 RepID=A0A811TXN2_CERCA|nr:unnamed protein product [Ceratitis capitata]
MTPENRPKSKCTKARMIFMIGVIIDITYREPPRNTLLALVRQRCSMNSDNIYKIISRVDENPSKLKAFNSTGERAQFRPGYCSRLNSYLSRLDHLYTCPHKPTHLKRAGPATLD